MPSYEVEHICPLTEAQKDEIAEAITKIHTTQFNAPRLFVNCRFTNVKEHAVYVAGKRVSIYSSHLLPSHVLRHVHDPGLLEPTTRSPPSDAPEADQPPQRKTNRVFASVRHGPSRTQADFENVSREIIKAWDSIVPLPQVKRSLDPPDTELRMVMFFGDLVPPLTFVHS